MPLNAFILKALTSGISQPGTVGCRFEGKGVGGAVPAANRGTGSGYFGAVAADFQTEEGAEEEEVSAERKL